MKNNSVLFFLFSALVSGHSCVSAQYKYVSPSKGLVNSYTVEADFNTVGFYDLTQSLPKGYKTNAKVDYTSYLQRGIDTHSKILMPNFPVWINRNGLKVGSNKTIAFQKNSLIRFTGPAHKKLDDVLKIYNAVNVTIYNAKIEGSKYAKIKQEGQWSAGISIINSRNVKVLNSKIYNTYGDGIFIGSENGQFSEGVLIQNGWIDNARRNGISITSAKDVEVSNVLISNTSGHAPQCGIDIEPSTYKDVIENVNLNGVYTFNNALAGIEINMNALNNQKVGRSKDVTINIKDHTDNKSLHALLTSMNGARRHSYDAKGVVNVTNSMWRNSRGSNTWMNPNDYSIKFNFKNTKIEDPSKGRNIRLRDLIKNKKHITVE